MLRATPWVSAALTTSIVLAAATPAPAATAGSTVLVSRPAGSGVLTAPLVNDSSTTFAGPPPKVAAGADVGRAVPHLVSSDNRFVAFVSNADGLSAEDNDAVTNVFVRDRTTQQTVLVSRATGVLGAAANGNSGAVALSGNGRYVAFESLATNLTTADTSGTTQVYVRDLNTQTTKLVSRATGASGQLADDSSFAPAVDDAGDVAFTSAAGNLGAVAGTQQVYLRRGALTAVLSRRHNGISSPNQLGDGDSSQAALSADGTHAAFASHAANLSGLPGDGAGANVFVRTITPGNLDDGATAMADRTGVGIGNDMAGAPSLNDDGSMVAFASLATNLNAGDPSGAVADIYVRTMSNVSIQLASVDSNEVKGTLDAGEPSLDAAGTHVAFTTASALASQDTNGLPDVYVRDLALGTTTLASQNISGPGNAPAGGGSVAPDGTHVALTTLSRGFTPDGDDDVQRVYLRTLGFVLGGGLALMSRPDGAAPFVSHTGSSALIGAARGGGAAPQAVGTNGRFVVFTSASDELSNVDDDRYANVFVRDTSLDTLTLVSRADGPGGAAGAGNSGARPVGATLGGAAPVAMTPDGRYVAFTSEAANLVSGDTNGHSDVFVRDLVAGTTTLISAKSDGTPALFDATSPSISADGRRVAFESAGQLVPVDVDSVQDVYVRDLQSGTTTLASRQTGAAGAPADDDSTDAVLSADGTHVAFATAATNLAPSLIDPNALPDVYVRDLEAEATKLVSSHNGAVHAGSGFATAPSISADGNRIAFESQTPSLAPGDANGALSDVYVRDVAAGTTTLASRSTAGFGADVAAGSPSISADGTRVAMSSAAGNLAAGAPAGGVFLRDLAASTTTLASRADGVSGVAAKRVGGLALSPDGHCVAFDSTDDQLTAGMPAGTDFFHVLLRGVDAACPPAPPAPAPPGGGGAPGPAPGGTGETPAPPATSTPPPASTADLTAPVLDALKLSQTRFRVASAPTALSAAARGRTPAGTRITFRLSEAARVALVVQRVTTGARRGRTCVKATKQLRGKPRCTLLVAAGTLTRSVAAGAVQVAFSGRLGRRALGPGRYRLRADATDAAGNRGSAKTVAFTVARR